MAFSLAALMSTFKNTAGARMFFGFLPPHGQTLDDNEEITIWGGIAEAILRGDRFGYRAINSLQTTLLAGDAEIKSTPVPVMYDDGLEVTKILVLHDGVLFLIDPTWEVSSSLS